MTVIEHFEQAAPRYGYRIERLRLTEAHSFFDNPRRFKAMIQWIESEKALSDYAGIWVFNTLKAVHEHHTHRPCIYPTREDCIVTRIRMDRLDVCKIVPDEYMQEATILLKKLSGEVPDERDHYPALTIPDTEVDIWDGYNWVSKASIKTRLGITNFIKNVTAGQYKYPELEDALKPRLVLPETQVTVRSVLTEDSKRHVQILEDPFIFNSIERKYRGHNQITFLETMLYHSENSHMSSVFIGHALVGAIIDHPYLGDPRSKEMFMWIKNDARGHGVGSQALKERIKQIKEEYQAKDEPVSFVANVHHHDTPSQKTLIKADFRPAFGDQQRGYRYVCF